MCSGRGNMTQVVFKAYAFSFINVSVKSEKKVPLDLGMYRKWSSHFHQILIKKLLIYILFERPYWPLITR